MIHDYHHSPALVKTHLFQFQGLGLGLLVAYFFWFKASLLLLEGLDWDDG
jgi:hypothetical protein